MYLLENLKRIEYVRSFQEVENEWFPNPSIQQVSINILQVLEQTNQIIKSLF